MQAAGSMISQIALHFTPSIFFDFITGYKNILLIMLLGYALHFVPKSIELKAQNIVTEMPLIAKAALVVSMIVILIQVKSSNVQPFIYFQF